MNNERKDQQIANNLRVLGAFSSMDANQEHIWSRIQKRVEAMRLVSIFLKRKRQDDQKAASNVELYLDDWVYQHGPITQANVKEAVADCVDRVVQQARSRERIAEENEFKQMQGPLGDGFDDEPFQGLPDDAAFEQAIVRQQKRKS
jgi:hypothetical protein